MALTTVTITEIYDDGSGNPLSGTVTFTPSATVYASGLPVLQPGTPVVAQVVAGQLKNASGGALTLVATDNAGLTVQGQSGFWFWNAAETISGQALPPWYFGLPSSPSTRELRSLANTSAVTAGYVQPGNGTVPGGRIWSGSGAPNIAASAAGDFYFRTDTPGIASQRIYVATAANTWTGIL